MNSVDRMIGERLRDLRNKKGISDWRVASELGMTCEAYRSTELGLRRLGAADMFAFARLMNCPISEIFDQHPSQSADVSAAAGQGSGQVLKFATRQGR